VQFYFEPGDIYHGEPERECFCTLDNWVWQSKGRQPPAIIDAFACTDFLRCFHKLHKRVDLCPFDDSL